MEVEDHPLDYGDFEVLRLQLLQADNVGLLNLQPAQEVRESFVNIV
jgi:hypothetical protein